MKIEKFKLDVTFEYEYEIWGLATTMNDYKLAWLINNIVGINLVRTDKDLEIDDPKKGKQLFFSCYKFYDELEWTSIHLISNNCYNDHLLPELKNFDYIFKIEGNIHSEYTESLFSTIKQLPDVQFMRSFDPEDLKTIINLLFNDKNLQQNENNSHSWTRMQ